MTQNKEDPLAPSAPMEANESDLLPVATGTPVSPTEQANETPAQATSTTTTGASITTTTTYTIPPPGKALPQVQLSSLGRIPCAITCPYCHAQGFTIPSNNIDCCSITIFVVLFFVFWPLCWLPFVIPDCQRTDHKCSSCLRQVGSTESCKK